MVVSDFTEAEGLVMLHVFSVLDGRDVIHHL